jgi:hypothetical protein
VKTIRFIFPVAAAVLLVITLTGCGDFGMGTLTLRISDAPVDIANRVVVQFKGVEVHSSSGDTLTYSISDNIDLLELTRGESKAILEDKDLDAGDYTWIRLLVNATSGELDSFIELKTGAQHSLVIPSGEETGLKLVRGFEVPDNGSADLTIDFDLRKSIYMPESDADDYVLKPSLRIVETADTGSISGSVDLALVTNTSCAGGNAVYAFIGNNVTPDDVDGADPDPVNTALVELESGAHTYKVAFLNAADYTVAFTCLANLDDPATDDAITFVGVANATVEAGESTTHNFSSQ